MTPARRELAWREVHWPVPLDSARALELLHRLATGIGEGPIVWEARGEEGRVRHLLGANADRIDRAVEIVRAIVGGVAVWAPAETRAPVSRATRLQINPSETSLATDRTIGAARAILAALSAARDDGETLVLQVALGRGLSPRPLPAAPADPTRSWFEQLVAVAPAPTEIARQMRDKRAEPGFEATVRVAATAASEGRRVSLLGGVLAALRTLQSPGVRMELLRDQAQALLQGAAPGWFPLRLSSSEVLALLGWPLDVEDLPGMPRAHPRQLALSIKDLDRSRAFATTTAPGPEQPLGIAISDALVHTAILGPTNSGKSTVMLNLIAADIAAGRGTVVIDPKGDLVADVLVRIPAHRSQDVVVLDPTQAAPVGLNPLRVDEAGRELAVDRIVGIFRELFPSMFGPRTADVLHASLLTLVRQENATLAWLPRVLSDPAFRDTLTRDLEDEELRAFWTMFDAMSARQQLQFIGPVLSRLRQFLLRPGLRRVLDQPEPLFDLRDVFSHRRILLVPLNTGLIGGDAARLLGSLLVSQLWQLTLGRVKLTPERRSPVSIYVDEAQEFVRLGHDLPDALARSRSLGVAWHLANQFRDQLPAETRSAIDANALNKIVFTLGPKDARELAAMAPELTAEDFMALDQFEIYAHLIREGRRVGWVSGKTLKAPRPISDAVELLAASRARYGAQPTEPSNPAEPPSERPDEPIGRRKRSAS